MSQKYCKQFHKIYSFTSKISNLCGVDVIQKNYKINWRTVAIFLLINLSIAFTFYTNYVQVVVEGNYYHILKSTSIIGTGIQGYVKLINVVKNRDNLCYFYYEITEIYKSYENKSLAYKHCLKNSISLAKKVLLTTLWIIVIIFLAVILIPTYMIVFMNQRIELMPFSLPFVDVNTDFGYFVTYSIHIICVFFGGFGNFFVDSWLFLYVAHIPLLKNILECKFNDLDEIMETQTGNERITKDPLKDITLWLQKYMEFCRTIKNTFYWVIFVQISTECLGIVSTIVCIFLDIWPPAPAYLLYLFVIFYSYCILGNLVEDTNDDVIFIIYNSCWYKLSNSQQKNILIMLRQSQKPNGISIGGVAPLSMRTALQVTKTVYTISMLLKNSLN